MIAVSRPAQPTTSASGAAPSERARRFACLGRDIESPVEVEAVAHDHDLPGGRDAQPHEVVANLVADRDHGVGSAREAALEEAEDLLAAEVEVAAQHVTVERVHERSWPTPPNEQRSDAAGRAGFGGVGLEDVGLACAEERAEAPDRGQIVTQRELPPELRHVQVRYTEIVGQRLHGRLAWRNRARHNEHVMAARLLGGCELEHRERSASDVQSRDHMHDSHAALTRAIVAAAGTSPTVIQKTAASGVPPNSPSPAIAPSVPAVQTAGI